MSNPDFFTSKGSQMTTLPSFIFPNLPDIARDQLVEMIESASASAYLTDSRNIKSTADAHGELVLSTIAVIAAKIVIPVLVTWLLNLAPLKIRKETIIVQHPDGRKITLTIEYSKGTDPLKLVKILTDALEQGID